MQACCALTHSCLDIFLTSVVWTYDIFESNFEINHNFDKYLTNIWELWVEIKLSISSNVFWKLLLLARNH